MAVGDHLGDTGVGTVGLVDDQNHRQVRGESLAQHEPGLRQRALGGVDQQQHAVDHRQAALHLAAEIGVAGGVDDVDDRHRAIRVVAVHRGVLGQDGDALFLLQVTGVHQALNGVITSVRERTRLFEHRVDQGCLAVVDVRNNGYVPETMGHVCQFWQYSPQFTKPANNWCDAGHSNTHRQPQK
ncbi:Uncharacterised protein [Mycobacteroides abscessus]|nr:Uncharacterised protein [Mycobacteroides abscessus]